MLYANLQAISKFPAFTPALCEKALLLASSNDWEQALDCAQRLLDGDDEHLDGLLIIAVHAYTQEGLSHDAVQKLEDIDNALKKKEASSVVLAVQIASLFARICGRHPRTLQLCARLLERSLRAASMSHSLPAEVEAKVLCVLGEVYLRMGRAQLEKALAVLREATKRDATNLRVLLTLIHAQLVEGAVEDAEAQVELLSLMHSNLDELGHEILYLQALILRQKRVLMAQQQQSNSSHSSSIHGNEEERQREELLLRCKHLFLQAQSSSLLSALQMNSDSETNASLLDPDVSFLPTHFSTLYRRDPDFALLLSQEFFSMMESTALGASLVPSAAPSAGLLSANTLSNGPDADPSAPPPPSQRYTNHLTTLGNGRQTMAMVAPMHVHHHSSPSQQQPRGGFGQGVATALTLGDVTATLNTLSLVGSSIGQSSTVGGGASSSVASTMGTSSEASRETLEAMQHGLDLLTPLLSLCPGILPVYIESARAYSTAGRFDEAAQTLQSALALQPQSAPVLIALALVEAARWQTSVAARYVEQALSADFAVRSVSKFRLVRALVRAQQSKFAEAIDEMVALLASADFNFYSLTNTSSSSLALGGGGDAVMMDPAFQREQQLQQQQQQANNLASDIDGGNSSDMLRLTLDDKVLAFVSMASLLSHERRMKEARQVLAHAKMLFAGLNQEVVVLVAAARLYVDKGDFDAAVRMLDKISPDTTAFVQAQLVKADILLQHNHDKEGYARCFQLLVDRQRSPANLSLLAEAFLRILNPEKAVDVFEEAFKLDPRNTRLRARIGRTLVSTHEYHRAVEFYESAVRQILSKLAQQANNQYTGGSSNSSNSFSGVGTNNNMQSSNANQHHSQHQQQQQQLLLASEDFGLVLDLAALYRRLNRHESAARVLNDLLLPQYEPFLRVKHRVQALLQLSIVQQQLSSDAALQQTSLLRAHALQREHVSGLRNASVSLVAAQKERIEEERTFLAAICCQLGVALLAEGELSEAERYYDEALRADAQCLAAMLGLAQVALRRSEYDKCAQQCAKVLTAAPTHRDAAILHAETLLRLHDNDPEPAVKPLVAYLELIPADYLALDKAIGLLRRAGQLPDALRLLKEAEQHDKRFVAHPGYHYCSGLYARFTNDIGKAIASFNLARRDSLFAAFSLAHMIELYLNPDQEGIWEEKDTGPVDEETRQHIAAAEELLRELKLVAGSEDMRVRVLEGYCLLSTRNKVAVDKAMQTFAELLDVNQEYLPAVLGMATGFMIEKNQVTFFLFFFLLFLLPYHPLFYLSIHVFIHLCLLLLVAVIILYYCHCFFKIHISKLVYVYVDTYDFIFICLFY